MKRVILISYWVLAVVMIAMVVASLGYTIPESFFIGVLFLPGALAVKFFFGKVSFRNKAAGIKNCLFITIGVVIGEILLFMIAHATIACIRSDTNNLYEWPPMPDILLNPVFTALMTGAFAVVNVFLEKWLEIIFPSGPKTVSFLSERKPISLSEDDILYIESNDAVTTVYASNGRQFRNKTPISQWEATLGDDYIRIHRSYLVRRSAIVSFEADAVTVGATHLPVSRKYKDRVISQLG